MQRKVAKEGRRQGGGAAAFGNADDSWLAAIESLVHELGHFWALYLDAHDSMWLLQNLWREEKLETHVGTLSDLVGVRRGDRHELEAIAATILVLEPVLKDFDRDILCRFAYGSVRSTRATEAGVRKRVERYLHTDRAFDIAFAIRRSLDTQLRMKLPWVDHPIEDAIRLRNDKRRYHQLEQLRKDREL